MMTRTAPIASSRFAVADFAGGGLTTPSSRQRASMAYFLGWPDAHVRSEGEARGSIPTAKPGAVAFGRFSMSDAAIGGAVLLFLLWHFATLAPD